VRLARQHFFCAEPRCAVGGRGGRKKQSLLHNDDASASGGGTPVGLTPKWMALVDEVHDSIGQIKSKMSELTQKHADHIQVRFGTANDQEQQIEVLTGQITKMYQGARMKVERIGRGEKTLHPDEEVMKGNIQRALASDLQDLSVEFRASQESYLQALQARKERSQRKLGPTATASPPPEEPIVLMERHGDGNLSQLALEIDTGAYDEAVERDRELRNVAKSIRELSDIFRDLAILVIDQGSALDRIDCNLENTSRNMVVAVEHLEKANDYTKGARLRNFMLILLALILVMVVILVIRLGTRHR
jgi:syntaxin 16